MRTSSLRSFGKFAVNFLYLLGAFGLLLLAWAILVLNDPFLFYLGFVLALNAAWIATVIDLILNPQQDYLSVATTGFLLPFGIILGLLILAVFINRYPDFDIRVVAYFR